MSKVVMGNGGFTMIETQGDSAWWKETAQTRVFYAFFSFLVAESP